MFKENDIVVIEKNFGGRKIVSGRLYNIYMGVISRIITSIEELDGGYWEHRGDNDFFPKAQIDKLHRIINEGKICYEVNNGWYYYEDELRLATQEEKDEDLIALIKTEQYYRWSI